MVLKTLAVAKAQKNIEKYYRILELPARAVVKLHHICIEIRCLVSCR